MDFKSIFKTPVFIPKLGQGEADFVKNKKIAAIIMDAHIVAQYPNPVKAIRKAANIFMINPMTNAFIENSYKDKPVLSKLPTAPKTPYKVQSLLTDESIRKYKMVWGNIEYQIKNGGDIIIIPYLYADSIDDSKFSINLSMVSDALTLLEKNKINLPRYAMINIGGSILKDYTRLNQLIDRYHKDFSNKLSGFFIMINQFDCREADEESMIGLAHLSFYLAENNKDIILLKMGDFGEILCAIGATGYSSSLAGGEVFDAEGLAKVLEGRGRNHKKFTYAQEMFNYFNDEMLKKIGYKCNCSFCNGGIPNGFNTTKAHFLDRKLRRMQELSRLNRGKRIDFLKLKIEEAVKLIIKYNASHNLRIKTDFLLKWKNVLVKAENWDYTSRQKEELIDLDQLIEKAKKSK